MKRVISLVLVLLILSGMFAGFAGASLNLTAASAVVLDFETGEILYQRNANAVRVPASMSKTLTAFVTYEEIAAGRLSMDTQVTISPNVARISVDSSIQQANVPFRAGDKYSVNQLLHLVMLPSSTGACIALAEHISGSHSAFVDLMNETGKRIGMLHVDFRNSHGSFPNYTTAYSMGILVREFIQRHPDILKITSATTFQHGNTTRRNTNQLLPGGNYYYQGVDGFKTGTTREAGSCLQSTAVRGGRRIIVVVMGAPGDSPGRYSDSRALLDYGFAEAARRAAERINVTLNGQRMQFDVPARMINGRVMVPMRDIFTALGARVQWDSTARRVTATTSRGDVIVLTAGSNTMTVNGVRSTIDVAPVIIDGRMLVPVRFVATATGATVSWNGAARTVVIRAG